MRFLSILGIVLVAGLVVSMSTAVSAILYYPHGGTTSDGTNECAAWGHYRCVCPIEPSPEIIAECAAWGNIGRGR